MHAEVCVLVIIEAGPLQACIIEGKAQRSDQMQPRTGVRAQANHVAGIRRDLGTMQDDIEHWRIVDEIADVRGNDRA